MKSHLVSKQITDKNGVQTTRWVKPSSYKASATTIPGPSVSPDKSHVQKLMDTAAALLSGDSGDATPNITFLAQSAPDRLESIVQQCEEDESLHQLWSARIRHMNMVPFDESEDEYLMSLNFYDRHIAMYPLAIGIIRDTNDHYMSESTLRRFTQDVADEVTSFLMRGTDLGNRKEREFPTDEMVKALTIVTSIRGMYSEAYWRMDNSRVTYDDVVDDATYISQHLEEVVPLVPALIERKSHDKGLIREMVEGDASALSSGTL